MDNIPFFGQAPADGADRSRYVSESYEIDHAEADIAIQFPKNIYSRSIDLQKLLITIFPPVRVSKMVTV